MISTLKLSWSLSVAYILFICLLGFIYNIHWVLRICILFNIVQPIGCPSKNTNNTGSDSAFYVFRESCIICIYIIIYKIIYIHICILCIYIYIYIYIHNDIIWCNVHMCICIHINSIPKFIMFLLRRGLRCRWVAFHAAAWAPASAVSIQSNVQVACNLKWLIKPIINHPQLEIGITH